MGWFENNEKISDGTSLSYTFTMPEEPKTLVAKWIKVDLIRNNSEAGNVISYENKAYAVGDEATVSEQTNKGYTWVGWFDGNTKVSNGTELRYTFTMPEESKVLTAKWIKVTLKKSMDEGGSIESYANNPYVAGDEASVAATTNPGYTWVGWFKDGEKVSNGNELSYTFTMPEENTILTAKWIKITLEKNIDEAGEIECYENKAYIAGEEATVTASTNNGYTWVGWFDGDTKVSNSHELTYTFNMPEESKILTAKWIECPVTLTQNIADIGTVSGVEGATAVGEDVTIAAKRTTIGYVFDGWYENNLKVSKDDNLTYTFVMPELPKELEARWKICEVHTVNENCVCTKCDKIAHGLRDCNYCRHENKIYFGTYPQSKVTEYPIINALNHMYGEIPQSWKRGAWTDYGYYTGGSIYEYMWYIDIPYNGEKYRGVYFDKYRPINTFLSVKQSNAFNYSRQYVNNYHTGNVYWFKWEPIVWNILSNENGGAFILSDKILDSQQYYYDDERTRSIDGETVYPNNYKESDIRAWLNGNFYNTAFGAEQQSIIKTTLVDKSLRSTAEELNKNYFCADTEDKIFLLSLKELNDYNGRIVNAKITTDYAQCQGATTGTYNGFGEWWLRSLSYTSSSADIVTDQSIFASRVSQTSCGIVPAINIKIAG